MTSPIRWLLKFRGDRYRGALGPIPWYESLFRRCRHWRDAGGREGGRREYGEPEANATVAGSVEEFAAALAGPRMLQQRGCIATATTPATTASSASSSSSSSSSSSNMFPQQYCLRWKYHHSNLQTMFSQLLERQAYCDVTLACEGKTLRAHKVNRAEIIAIMTRHQWGAFPCAWLEKRRRPVITRLEIINVSNSLRPFQKQAGNGKMRGKEYRQTHTLSFFF